MNSESKLPLVWAAIPAAGSGSRLGAALPKQYLELAGRALAEHTLEALLGVPRIHEVVVAIAADDVHWRTLDAGLRTRVRTVTGGADRAASVECALHGFSRQPADDDWVLVHDMARPCIRPQQIESFIESLAGDAVGGLLALPLVDTLKRADDSGRVVETLPRAALWRAQTPQMFRFALLRDALAKARVDGTAITDEAMAIENMGLQPRLIEGSSSNIKVTLAEDVALAEFQLERQRRVGI
jgi:2-C-methyl-D-erythritol 4-phosphate cytidylyltransferase